MRKVITIYWDEIDAENQEICKPAYDFASSVVKQTILDRIRLEKEEYILRAISGVISELGKKLLKNQAWQQLLDSLNSVSLLFRFILFIVVVI